MRKAIRAIAIGALTTLLGAGIDALTDLEAGIGLQAFFHLRGPRAVPPAVVVVAIDETSSRRLARDFDRRDWPRSLHAQLVNKLKQQGARVIAFDILFPEPMPTDNAPFANAMRNGGNVLLFACVDKRIGPLRYGECPELPDEDGTLAEDSADGLVLSRMVEPTPRLAEAALAVAPFPLVKRPHPVREAWAFEESLGNVPTLPLVAFHHYVLPEVREELASLSADAARKTSAPNQGTPAPRFLLPDVLAVATVIRRLCAENTGVPPTSLNASPNAKRLFRILADVYCDGDSRYLDFYGPAYTIPTVSYSDVLEGRVTGLRDKAVFVGRATEKELIDKDTFVTVFSDPNGMNLSGVEIMATLFANLVEGRQIEPPLSHRWLTLGWGVVVAALVLALPLTPALLGSVVATAVYSGIAHWIFGRSGLWLPVAIPVLIQLPLAWLIALGWHLADQRAERLRLEGFIESVFPNWDPSARYARGAEPQREAPFQGVCLATDVQDFTRLAEEMGARELHMLLQKYYAVLGRPVAEHGGLITDVEGDAMLAVWKTAADVSQRERGCLAALEIAHAVDAFNRDNPHKPLSTRIGLHRGEMVLGTIRLGNARHHRAIGDTINTANRIQAANKALATRILVSLETLAGIDNLAYRVLGEFRLKGKTQAVSLCELVGRHDTLEVSTKELHEEFRAAVGAFRAHRLDEATEKFEALLSRHENDGPSRFYLAYCRNRVGQTVDPAWTGIVSV